MGKQIILLRAVNVGGHGKLGMADLRTCLLELGLEDVQTVLQSGNAVVRSPVSGERLAAMVEAGIQKRFGMETEAMVRSAGQWAALVAGNPFPVEAKQDPSRLAVLVPRHPPTGAAVEALAASLSGPEVMRDVGGHLYIWYPDGMGRTKLTGTFIERKLAIRVTGRNWNTVLKLAERVRE